MTEQILMCLKQLVEIYLVGLAVYCIYKTWINM